MATVPKQSAPEAPPHEPEAGKIPNIAAASVPDTLAALQVNPDTGLTQAEVDIRRKQHGFNEVAETKEHPVLRFLSTRRSKRRSFPLLSKAVLSVPSFV